MLCTFCFAQEATIYLDCYCLFCLECYTRYEREFEAARKQNMGRQALCAHCSRKTLFKRCDLRVQNDANTIKELTLDPKKASLRAAETFQFYLLHSKKQASFNEAKCAFLERVIDHLIVKGQIIDLSFPEAFLQADSFGFIKRLQESYQSFTLDNIKPVSFFHINTQNVPEEPAFCPAAKPLIRAPPLACPVNVDPSSHLAAYKKLSSRAIAPVPAVEERRQPREEESTKGTSIFAFKSIKKSGQVLGNSSNRQSRYNLQNQILEASNCHTPLLTRKYV